MPKLRDGVIIDSRPRTKFDEVSKSTAAYAERKLLEYSSPINLLRKFCGLDRIRIYRSMSDKGRLP